MLQKPIQYGVCLVLLAASQALGQYGGITAGVTGSPGWRAAGRAYGMGSGRGLNPALNPPGSWSVYQTLHPSASLGAAAVRNPRGSYFRPPGGDSAQTIRPPRLNVEPVVTSRLPRAVLLDNGNPDHSRQWVATAAQQLSESLRRFVNGAEWSSFLRVEELRNLLHDQTQVLSTDQRRRLQQTLARYDAMAESEAALPISRLKGFSAVRSSLGAFLQ